MISDLTINSTTNTEQTAAASSRHTSARRDSTQPLRPWSTPRLLRINGDGTEKPSFFAETFVPPFLVAGPS